MFPHNLQYAVILLLAAPACVAAQSVLTDQQAYCAYLTEQAKAQSEFLRTPSATGGFTQPDTGLPQQLVAGAQLSISNLKKAGITEDVARKNCVLYRDTISIQQNLQYALPNIERDALRHRVELIDEAAKSLGTLIDKSAQMVAAQNMTRPMLWALKTNKIKLESDRADAQSKIAAIYIPALTDQPLKSQVAAKQASDIEEQKAQAKLNRQNNWDVALTAGGHQQINPVAQGFHPYGEVTLSYNLGSRAIDKHLDRSVAAYGDWKKVQEGDVIRGLEELRGVITAQIAAQESRLKGLQEETAQAGRDLQQIGDADSTAALDFRNQLTTTQLLLGVETGDASYRLDRLREFLAKNF
jgi:hypothetical protein